MTRLRPLFVALAAVCALLAAPAVAQAAETIEFQAGSSYGTNNISHIVTVNVAGGPASGTAHVLWSLAHNSGGAASQTAVDISLDGSGVGSGSLTYTPSYPAPASDSDIISGVCVDSNTSGACDGGEPVPAIYTSHTVYVGEPYVSVSGSTSLNTGDSASLSVHAQAYGTGTDLAGVTVQWTHSGVNTSSNGSFSTNGTGNGTITTWPGTNPGQDGVRAWIDDAGGTTGTYESGEGTGTAAVVFTQGTITLSSLNGYYLTGATPSLTATVYSDGNNGATTPATPVGSGVAVKYQINGGTVQTTSTDSNSQIPISLSSPDPSTNPSYVSVHVWRDVVGSPNDSIDSGEPNAFTSTTFNVPSVSYASITPASTLGLGRNVTFSYVTQDFDYSALPSQTVCWLVTSGPNMGHHGVTAASDTGGNGTYTYTSSTAGTDYISFWLSSKYACGPSAPPSTVQVTTSAVTWVMAISSGGPVTDVYADSQLNCQAQYGGDVNGEFYGSTYSASSSCHPFLVVDGSYTSSFSAVSQTGPTPISGGGYEIDTTTCANVTFSCGGGTNPLVTQVVTYYPGANYYRTDYTVQFRDGASHTVRLYQYADCFLQNSDRGYGFASDVGSGGNGGIYCSQNAGNSPQGRIEGFVPLTAGGSYYEAGYGGVYSAITSAAGTGHMFDNSGDVTSTCQCGIYQDNGMAIGWEAAVPANGTLQRSLLTDFSPTGVTADLVGPSVTLDVPVDGSATTVTQPTFSGQAGTLSTDLPTVTVDVYQGSSASGSPTASYATTASGGSWSVQADSALALGTYTTQARQSDQSGNVGHSAPHTFTIVEPTSTSTSTSTSTTTTTRELSRPVFGQSVNLVPVSGTVFVTEPSGKRVPLTSPDQIVLGSVIDATKGRVRLTITDKTGQLQTADFYQGVFKISQLPKKKGGILKLALVGSSFNGCPAGKARKAAGKAAGKNLKRTASVRHLWGSGTGPYRTQGRFSAATVRGTNWLTDDRCDGTLTRVVAGLVTVHDDVRNKDIVVKQGKSYLATPR